MPKYRRVVLKVSGEQFHSQERAIDFHLYNEFAQKLLKVRRSCEIELAIVVGGGNIFRGREANTEVDRTVADSIGMLATVMNGLALQDALERQGDGTRLMTAMEMKALAEPYIRRRAIRQLEKGRVVIIAGGLGKPFFTTDTAVVHYAAEMKADLILKASTVDGVYDKDPNKYADARRYERLTFDEAVDKRLGIMDATAFTLCRDSGIPIVVFKGDDLGDLPRFFEGKKFGTLVEP